MSTLMRMPIRPIKSEAKRATVPSYHGLAARRCTCGKPVGPDGECAACQAKRLSRLGQPASVPRTVDAALRASGRPLEPAVRAPLEARFGHDFSQVRVHQDAQAAAAAQVLGAAAFTVRRDVFFAPGHYAPATSRGRLLLAHELAHTIQQGDAPSGVPREVDARPDQEAEAELVGRTVADGAATGPRLTMPGSVTSIQRRLDVANPSAQPAGAPPGETNGTIVRGYVTTLCSGFTVTSGTVQPSSPATCAASPGEACACLCDMSTLRDPATGADIVWTVVVSDREWPHTDDATRTVTVHSPYSGVEFGAWAVGPPTHRMTEANWLVLGHELCGHARLFAHGRHPTGPPATSSGRPSHDPTVEIERRIAAEHGSAATDLRGLFRDPHHGESFGHVTIAQFPSNSASIAALPAAERGKLDIAESFIKSAPVRMDVIGHADQVTSSAAASQVISEQRAESVRAELVRRGIAASRFVTTRGIGASECTTPGDQPFCRKADVFMYIFESASVTRP